MSEARVLHHLTYTEFESNELIKAMKAAWRIHLYTRVTATMITTMAGPQAPGFTLELSDKPFPNPTEREEAT